MFQQPFYPHQQTRQNFSHNRGPTNAFMSSRIMFYPTNDLVVNRSTHNLNLTHDFERFSMPRSGFTSIPAGGYPFFNMTNRNFEQQRYRQNATRVQEQRHRRTPAFQFQDKSTSYFMTNPVITNDDRIAIQLTKVHIGPNGDQQRVFVEQEFSNERALNRFVRHLRHNFDQTFNNRSFGRSATTDESKSTINKKPGVIVVEEPDEEPRIYQQQTYNANIESKERAARINTPSISPMLQSESSSKVKDRFRSADCEHHPTKRVSPPIARMSSSSSLSSTARSNRLHKNKNKMKYRRQQTDDRQELKFPRMFHRPRFTRRYQATPTPTPTHSQQRFFTRDNAFHMPRNPNFQWIFNHNGYSKTRSRSYVPPINENVHPPPSTSSRFQHTIDPFFQTIHSSRCTHQHHRRINFRPSTTNSKFHHLHHGKPNESVIITENLMYPNNQQQPRVRRTKSECQNFQKQQQKHRGQSTINHFQNFSPLKQPPIIQTHFTPFCSPPVFVASVSSTIPILHPNPRRQFGAMQTQLRLVNHFHLSKNRF